MRTYIAKDFTVKDWSEVEVYFTDLLNRTITNKEAFSEWLKNRSELDAVLEENMAWRYIKMTIDTTNEEHSKSYQFFVNEIQPKLAPLEDQLNKKMMESPFIIDLEVDEAYQIYFRGVKTALELYREENIELETTLNNLSQEYSTIIGKQSITYKEETLTMPQAANFLKDQDENVRKEVFILIAERRKQDRSRLDEIFNEMVQLRNQIAKNAGCVDFREYKFKALGRFDYTIQDCLDFHESIAQYIVPISKKIQSKKAKKLGKSKLRPWDAEVDPDGNSALKPFVDGNELLTKSIATFDRLDTYFGDCLRTMKEGKFLDLESKAGKAAGGYNYPLYESNIPFIFMNAAGSQNDLTTMVHEGGHAVHSFLSKDLELTAFKSLPSEVAELASMSMELITMDAWDEFYSEEKDLLRAKREQLEGIIKVLPWIAIVDSFQHWIYTNPNHTVEERTAEWLAINDRFGTGMTDFTDYEYVREASWHRQLHIFEVPFYYIEYGIAQLGALGVWKNYVENATQAISDYKNALKLGYSRSIPEIYKTANLQFDFSEKTVKSLGKFMEESLDKLN